MEPRGTFTTAWLHFPKVFQSAIFGNVLQWRPVPGIVKLLLNLTGTKLHFPSQCQVTERAPTGRKTKGGAVTNTWRTSSKDEAVVITMLEWRQRDVDWQKHSTTKGMTATFWRFCAWECGTCEIRVCDERGEADDSATVRSGYEQSFPRTG